MPSALAAEHFATYAYEHGLIVMRAGMDNHVIRTLMPLSTSDGELDKGLHIMEEALTYASRQVQAAMPQS